MPQEGDKGGRLGNANSNQSPQALPRAARLHPPPHLAHCTLDQLCQTTSVLDVPHQGTAFLHSPTTLVGCCCWVADGLETHIAHQSLEDNKFCFELLHLHGQLLLAGFSLLGFLSRAEGDVQISISVGQLGCRGQGGQRCSPPAAQSPGPEAGHAPCTPLPI